jgi:ABC-type transport system involved in multi-copper enzyme maturation permease subunit
MRIHAYWKLLRKEFEGSKMIVSILLASVILWDIFLYSRLGKSNDQVIFVLSVLPFGIIPLWALLDGFLTFRREWQGNHMYLLLSLPVKGWHLTTAKFITTAMEMFVYVLVTGAGTFLVNRRVIATILESLPDIYPMRYLVWAGVQIFFVCLLGILSLLCISQFSYIVGRMFERFGGLISVWTFVLSLWLLLQFTWRTMNRFNWVPDMFFRVLSRIEDYQFIETAKVSTAPIVAGLVGVIALFSLGSWLLEKHVEL